MECSSWLLAAGVPVLLLLAVCSREVLMGVGDEVASVIMLTFTKRPGPHAHFYKEARLPC